MLGHNLERARRIGGQEKNVKDSSMLLFFDIRPRACLHRFTSNSAKFLRQLITRIDINREAGG